MGLPGVMTPLIIFVELIVTLLTTIDDAHFAGLDVFLFKGNTPNSWKSKGPTNGTPPKKQGLIMPY